MQRVIVRVCNYQKNNYGDLMQEITEEEGARMEFAPPIQTKAKVETSSDSWYLPELPDTEDINEACVEMLPDIMRMYRQLVNDPEAPAAARIAAAKEITDRAIGKVGAGGNDGAGKAIEDIYNELLR